MDELQKPPALGALVLTEEELAAQEALKEQVQLGPLALGLVSAVGPLVGGPDAPAESVPARLRGAGGETEEDDDGADDDADDEDDDDFEVV